METNNSSMAWLQNGTFYGTRSDTEVSIFVILYILLSATVVGGNFLVVASYVTNLKLRTGISMFFVSLAVSDLCVGLVSIPLWIFRLVCPTVERCISNKNDTVLTFFRPFDIFSALASILNLVAISIERRIVISNAKLIHKRLWFKKVNLAMILFAWLLALGISIYHGIFGTSKSHSKSRTLLVFLGGFVVPLFVMVVIYIDIYWLVKKTQERYARETGAEDSQRGVRISYEERKTAQTVAIITALFVVAWTPFFVVSVLYTFNVSLLPSGKKLTSLIDFIKWMHYSNSAVNPFVYAYRNEVIRGTMLGVLSKCTNYLCCKDRYTQARELRHFHV